jgi:hypothetical protein
MIEAVHRFEGTAIDLYLSMEMTDWVPEADAELAALET